LPDIRDKTGKVKSLDVSFRLTDSSQTAYARSKSKSL
jgi:hypothetical protein